MGKKRGRAKRTNPMARAVRTPRFRPRVVRSKRAYSRNVKYRRPHRETGQREDRPG